MSNYIATVIKTGNSFALRLPKAYFAGANLKVGEKIELSAPSLKPQKYDPKKVLEAIKDVQQNGGAYANIVDPVVWQHEIRKDRPLPGRD